MSYTHFRFSDTPRARQHHAHLAWLHPICGRGDSSSTIIAVNCCSAAELSRDKSAVIFPHLAGKVKDAMTKPKSKSETQTKAKSSAKRATPFKFKGRAFDEWRKRFEASLKVGTDAHKRFVSWIEVEEVTAAKFNLPWRDDCRGHVLESLHADTSPDPHFEQGARKNNEYIKKELGEIRLKLENLAKAIRQRGIFPPDISFFPIYTDDLLKSFDCAAREAARIFALVDRPYSHQPQILDQCMPLFRSSNAPLREVCDLAYLAMKAHGYEDTELTALNVETVRSKGTVRNRKKAELNRYAAFLGIPPQKKEK